jgi:homocysteine S-methyltransferase
MTRRLGDGLFITDGGMETTLIFHQGFDLPDFASFVLIDDPTGAESLRAYYRTYIEIARARNVGIILDTPTWRAARRCGRSARRAPISSARSR